MNEDVSETVRTAVLSQFAKGELKLPIPLDSIQPPPDPVPRTGRFRRWLTEGRRARTEAALLAQHGKFLMAYTNALHEQVVPANGKAVQEICTAAIDVVHNQQLRRRAASAFQAVAGILRDYAAAKDEIEAIRDHVGDEAIDAAFEAAEHRFRECLNQINPNGRPEQPRMRHRNGRLYPINEADGDR